MVDISEIGITYHLSTENIISGQLDDFANLTKEFFDNLTKVYSQRGRPPTNTEALNKIGEDLSYKGDDLKKSLQTAIEQINVYKDIDKVKEEITKVDKEILQTHSQLKEAEKILAVAVFQAKKEVRSRQTSQICLSFMRRFDQVCISYKQWKFCGSSSRLETWGSTKTISIRH